MAVQLSTPPAEAHIAPCGLFCANCRKLKIGKCKGCQIEPGFKACSIRKCRAEKGITLCDACGFKVLSDISASAVQQRL